MKMSSIGNNNNSRRNGGAAQHYSASTNAASSPALAAGQPMVGIKEVFVDKRYTDAIRMEVDR